MAGYPSGARRTTTYQTHGTSRMIGYECEFVEKPPDAFQTECPVCLSILRDPYQMTCCGKSYCHTCIDKVRRERRSCPTCKKRELSYFQNKGLKQSLCQMNVYCTHQSEGCSWTGELGQLDKHLNTKPIRTEQLHSCKFVSIKCLHDHCSEYIKRSKIENHQQNMCPRRPFTCEYCANYKSYHEDVTKNHWPLCNYYPTPCPNECGKTLQRQQIENHIDNDCPLTVIDCDFKSIGCRVYLPRKDMPAHLESNVFTHGSLEIKEKVTKLEERMTKLEERMTKGIIEMERTLSIRIEEMEQSTAHQTAAMRSTLESRITKLEKITENEMAELAWATRTMEDSTAERILKIDGSVTKKLVQMEKLVAEKVAEVGCAVKRRIDDVEVSTTNVTVDAGKTNRLKISQNITEMTEKMGADIGKQITEVEYTVSSMEWNMKMRMERMEEKIIAVKRRIDDMEISTTNVTVDAGNTNRLKISQNITEVTENLEADMGKKITEVESTVSSMEQNMKTRMERMEERIVARVANQEGHVLGLLKRNMEDLSCGGLLFCHIINIILLLGCFMVVSNMIHELKK